MSERKTDNPENFPALGRMFLWVDRPGSANKIFWALAALCVLLFLADFTFEKHGKFDMENWPGFYAAFGFVAFSGVIFGATMLRKIIKRREDYYGDKSVDAEEYPADGTDRAQHDD